MACLTKTGALCLVGALTFLPFYVQASQSPTAPECILQGLVLSLEERKEGGRGLSEGQVYNYLDIAVEITEAGFAVEGEREQFGAMKPPFHCDQTRGDAVVYQARDPDDFALETDDCIAAKSKFHADGNFRSGNWIYDIEALPANACE